MVVYRTIAELKTEASRNYLGILWWFLEPALYMLVFYIVFGIGFRRGDEGFVPFLLCGLVAWKWFDSTIRTASNSISVNSGLIGQVYFPKYILPLSVVLTNTIKFAIIFGLLIGLLLIVGYRPGFAWGWLPLIVLVQFFLVTACALISAALIPFIPDLSYVINYGMTMLFFMSGVFFDVHRMAPEAQEVLNFNPVLLILDAYRGVLLQNEIPSLDHLASVTVVSLILLGVAWPLYLRLDRLFPKVVD